MWIPDNVNEKKKLINYIPSDTLKKTMQINTFDFFRRELYVQLASLTFANFSSEVEDHLILAWVD